MLEVRLLDCKLFQYANNVFIIIVMFPYNPISYYWLEVLLLSCKNFSYNKKTQGLKTISHFVFAREDLFLLIYFHVRQQIYLDC